MSLRETPHPFFPQEPLKDVIEHDRGTAESRQFSALLRSLRIAAEYTINDAADATGIHRNLVREYEGGNYDLRRTNIDVVLKFAALYNVSPGWLLGAIFDQRLPLEENAAMIPQTAGPVVMSALVAYKELHPIYQLAAVQYTQFLLEQQDRAALIGRLDDGESADSMVLSELEEKAAEARALWRKMRRLAAAKKTEWAKQAKGRAQNRKYKPKKSHKAGADYE